MIAGRCPSVGILRVAIRQVKGNIAMALIGKINQEFRNNF
jgi:hypothetical protein